MVPGFTLLVAALCAAADPEPFLEQYARTRRFTAGLPTQAKPTPDGDAVLFLRSGPRSSSLALHETDLRTGRTRELATAEGLLEGTAATLSAAERAELERQRIAAAGITGFQLSRDGKRIAVAVGGRLFLVDRGGGTPVRLATSGRPLAPRFSPDGRSISYVVDGDLRVLDLGANEERRLTSGATAEISRGTAEFVAQEELRRFDGHWWSPDSRWIAYQETDESAVERFTVHDPLHPEREGDTFRYPRPGRANASVRVGVVAAGGGPTTWLEWDGETHPYLVRVTWAENAPLTLLVMNRRQTEMLLLAAEPITGRTRPLVTERDPAWLEPGGATLLPGQGVPLWLRDGSGFFWFTERHGAPEIERRAADGRVLETWVGPESGFASLVGYDDRRGWLWFTGGPDPTRNDLYIAKRGASPLRWRTKEALGEIAAASISRNGEAVLVTPASFDALGTPVVLRPDGRRILALPSVAEQPPFHVRAEVRKVGEGEGLWTLVVRPRAMRQGEKLPVVVEVYGGPLGQMVVPRPRLLDQWIADQGFVVVSIDGRGTPRRGRAWARAIAGDFGRAPLEDQIRGLRALAEEVPELDLERVGVVGWSFGGYLAALAVLRQPEVFKAAVAGAPVADWRDYDTAYTERYLGMPSESPEAYERSSLLSDASRLERPLLLIHGTADDNVYFFHSLKLADALLRAGRPYQLVVLPGQTHLALASTDPVVVRRTLELIVEHFRRHLASAPARSTEAGSSRPRAAGTGE